MKYLTGQEETDAQTWMCEAAHVAKGALCLKAKCGTVIVKDGVVIGEGYNAPPLDDMRHGFCAVPYKNTGKPKYDHTCCVHAEWRAIMDALKRCGNSIRGSILYFTRIDTDGNIVKSGEPFCTVCSRLALDSGVAQFVLWHDTGICVYSTDEYNNLSYEYVAPEYR